MIDYKKWEALDEKQKALVLELLRYEKEFFENETGEENREEKLKLIDDTIQILSE